MRENMPAVTYSPWPQWSPLTIGGKYSSGP